MWRAPITMEIELNTSFGQPEIRRMELLKLSWTTFSIAF